MTLRAPPEAKEKDDFVILSVRLSSGRFESSISVPLFCSDAEREDFVGAWLKMMEAGIKCGREKRNAAANVDGEETSGK